MARPTNKFITDNKIKVLRASNSLYEKMVSEWLFFLSAYEGGRDYFSTNLFKHMRENDKDFNDRVLRAHNLNYCEILVDFFTNFIFSEPIERNGGSNEQFYNSFILDVDNRKSPVDKFMMSICDDMQIYGISYTLVDSPIEVVPILTRADDLTIKPYWISVPPIEIIDWALDEFGNYIYLKRKQNISSFKNVKLMGEKYTEYSLDNIKVTVVDTSDLNKPEIISENIFPNTIGEIPVVVTKYKDSKKNPALGVSFLNDFAYNNRNILNLSSLLDEFLYRQAFNILVMQTDGFTDSGTPKLVGTTNVLEYPMSAQQPQYISPPTAPGQLIQKQISIVKQEMFSRAAQDTMNELFNGEKRSGFSQAQSFSKTVPFISTRAEKLEQTENRLMELSFKYKGMTWDGKVKYKDRYELTNLTDTITQLYSIFKDLNVPSATFAKQELKRIVREFDSKLPIELKERIEAEIEAMKFDDWSEKVYSGNKSPAAQQKSKQTNTITEVQSESRVGTTNKLR